MQRSQRVNRVAVPSKQSSPPAEKCGVCIGVTRPSQAEIKLLEGGDIREVGAVGELRIAIRRTDNMEVAIAAHSCLHARRNAATALPVSRVPRRPPRSVVDFLAAIAASTAFSMAPAAVSNDLALLRRPCHASNIAAERISDSGFAASLPAISGAEPCAACAIP